MVEGKFLNFFMPPASIQTSVKFRDFEEPYLR